ncbi:MAG: hypothetical protein J4F30_05240 [Acidobacteria bacterium]|nr:hypothetical protein [Acidobacteriota bacterium]
MARLQDVLAGKAQLTEHGGQQSGAEFLAAILDDGLALAVVEHKMTAFAALHVDTNRHSSRAPDLDHPVDELPPLHPFIEI